MSDTQMSDAGAEPSDAQNTGKKFVALTSNRSSSSTDQRQTVAKGVYTSDEDATELMADNESTTYSLLKAFWPEASEVDPDTPALCIIISNASGAQLCVLGSVSPYPQSDLPVSDRDPDEFDRDPDEFDRYYLVSTDVGVSKISAIADEADLALGPGGQSISWEHQRPCTCSPPCMHNQSFSVSEQEAKALLSMIDNCQFPFLEEKPSVEAEDMDVTA
ncbi:hypothetical protein Q5752_005023 [Cryptotrichosporon argae]